jgi:acetyl-CoA carboxylase biotin carboxyl carrier protein
MDINDIESIVNILKESDVSEFELEQGGTRIKLVRGSGGHPVEFASHSPAGSSAQIVHLPLPHKPEAVKRDEYEGCIKVESPIVGTFYRRPSPDSKPFVKEGDSVTKGETLCIVEAMKLMNEIESPCGGKIEKIYLSDGEVVEYGEVLFVIKPAA